MEVEVDEGRRFVTGESRTHNAVVEAVEKGLPADPAPLRENRHLGQRLSHHAEKEVVAELHDAGELVVTDVGGTGAEQCQVRLSDPEGLQRAGYRQGEPSRARYPRVAHHGCG